MRSVHILHHSISPFAGQYPENDPLHYVSGIPMLFARAIRAHHSEFDVEVWRPECTLKQPYVWQDDDSITHRVFPSHYFRFNLEYSAGLISAVKTLSMEDRTYIWIHGIYNLHAYLFAPILKTSPVIAQSHGGFPARAMFSANRHRWLRYSFLPLHPLERATLPKYPSLFALSTVEKQYLVNYLSIPATKISLSPTGIDFERFSPGDKREARKACGLDEESQIVLYVGRLAPEKGVEYLLEGLPEVTEAQDRAQLLLVGTGPSQPDLESQVRKLGLDHAVRFVGYVEPAELPNWYRAADLTVIPSPIDWFPKVAMESMACETPIVIAEGGGAADIVQEFECGILVPIRDSARLTEAINTVLSGSASSCPNVSRGREAFDWTTKLSRSFAQFEKMSDAATAARSGRA